MPEQETFQRRQIAYKLCIGDVLNSRYIKTEGFNPNYLEIDSKEISRMNVIGVLVDKEENQKVLTLDDGTGRISARVFDDKLDISKLDIGKVSLVIGRPREFSSEKYILIEAIKNIDPGWAKVRNLELRKNNKPDVTVIDEKPTKQTEEVEQEIVLTPSDQIIKLIKELDKGNGVAIEDIPSNNIEDVDQLINALLKEGDIFEIKPGKLKVLE